ncbi:hypothetical protein ACZ87_02461, partial [Candidatus Erwinia dacicola]
MINGCAALHYHEFTAPFPLETQQSDPLARP